jgi:trans-aconitate methyltransferase
MKDQNRLEEGWFFHNHAWHLLHEIIKQIPEYTNSLLDYGAGTGMAAAIIQAVYPHIDVFVMDIETEECIDYWEKRNLAHLNLFDICPENYFDTIICSHVIEHIAHKEIFQIIEKLYLSTKKRIIIAVPDGDIHFYDHKTIFDRVKLNDIVDSSLYEYKGSYSKISFPVYHPHINNLMMVIDKK